MPFVQFCDSLHAQRNGSCASMDSKNGCKVLYHAFETSLGGNGIRDLKVVSQTLWGKNCGRINCLEGTNYTIVVAT